MANMVLDMDLEHPALDENIRDWVKVFSTLYCWTLYCWSTPPPPTPSLGGTLYCAYTGRIRPKGVPFSGLRYFRGFISIREGNFVNLVYKEHPAFDETIRNWVKVFSTLKSCIVGPHLFRNPPAPTPVLATLNIVAYTGKLCPKGLPFPGFRNMRVLFSIREGNFVNLVYIKE